VQFDLLLLNDNGRRVGCACGTSGPAKLLRRLNAGRYFALVRAVGHGGGRYRLSLLIREITSTSFSISASEIGPGQSVTLSPRVSATGGRVEIQIDRFDPLQGWVFSRIYRVPTGSSVTWTPPAIGKWRARASFLGTSTASPSRSGYAFLRVARPLGTP
jgi:hypothetical protein